MGMLLMLDDPDEPERRDEKEHAEAIDQQRDLARDAADVIRRVTKNAPSIQMPSMIRSTAALGEDQGEPQVIPMRQQVAPDDFRPYAAGALHWPKSPM